MFRPRRLNFFGARGRSGGAKSRRRIGAFETLESRTLLSASPLSTLTAQPLISPLATNTVPYGYTPAEIRHAYGFDQIAFTTSSGAVSGTGAGQTIAIVDAYNDPNIVNDLNAFDSQFGVAAPPKLTVVNENGSSRLPAASASWSMEISLDVEWAHAIAPGANILLVEANSSSLGDLLTGINYARKQAGVTAVSMSWGGSEFSGETSYNSDFAAPAGVTFVASSGDSGGDGMWPAVSPNVLAVGGSALSINSSSLRTAETAWSGSSGGVSAYESEPAYQTGVQGTGRRTTPDVAYDANPNTGVAIYDSVSYAGESGWFTVGGTSAGAPQWAALVAIANQGRALNGAGPLQNAPAAIYALPSSDFYDVTGGHNNEYSATMGYDDVTGLGAPNANLIVANLVYGLNPATTTAAPTTTTTTTTATTTTATTSHKTPAAPPHWTTGAARAAVVATFSGSMFSEDLQPSEASAVNSVASLAAETAAPVSAPPAAPASLPETAASSLAPTGVSVHRSFGVARAADAFFAELGGPRLLAVGAVLPTVG